MLEEGRIVRKKLLKNDESSKGSQKKLIEEGRQMKLGRPLRELPGGFLRHVGWNSRGKSGESCRENLKKRPGKDGRNFQRKLEVTSGRKPSLLGDVRINSRGKLEFPVEGFLSEPSMGNRKQLLVEVGVHFQEKYVNPPGKVLQNVLGKVKIIYQGKSEEIFVKDNARKSQEVGINLRCMPEGLLEQISV